MKTEIKTALMLGIIILVGTTGLYFFYTEVDLKKNTTNQLNIEDKFFLKKASDLEGGTGYVNTTKNDLEKLIIGNVILYDFWTYSCINCIRTLPYITAWDEKYRDDGLIIIGIHTPEFEFEKEKENVIKAVDKFKINYPIVLDNNKEIWNSFENNYWPRKYIADSEGYIRFNHIGEGAYKETEKVIQQLLQENRKNNNISLIEDTVKIQEYEHSSIRTPELYFGYKFANNRDQIGNSEGFQKNQIVDYRLPENLSKNHFYLEGQWKNNHDSMKLISAPGKIILEYHAKQVNIVAAGDTELEILIDGEKMKEKISGNDMISSKIRILEPRLYNIVESEYGETHTIIIKIDEPNFEIFTFTFG